MITNSLTKSQVIFLFQIRDRNSQLRSEAKTKCAKLVDSLYGFETGQNRRQVAANKTLAEELLNEKGYIFKVRAQCIGLCLVTKELHNPTGNQG